MNLRTVTFERTGLIPVLMLALLTGALLSCNGGENSAGESAQPQRTTGSTTQVLGSTIETWSLRDASGNLQEQGVTIPVEVFQGLLELAQQQTSRAPSHTGGDPHSEELDTDGPANAFLDLQFPEQSRQESFIDNLVMHLNPAGHPPERFLVPHLDFHYYSIPVAQVSQIGCDNQPTVGSDQVPQGFIEPGDCVPQMGLHSFREGAIESSDPFTRVMVTGFTEGDIIFAEPMITLDFLLQQQDFTIPNPAPSVLPEAALYPTTFEGNFDAANNEWNLVWSDFVSVPRD